MRNQLQSADDQEIKKEIIFYTAQTPRQFDISPTQK